MKQIGKLKHNYHDASLRRVCLEEERLVLEVELNSISNGGNPGRICLAFEGVRNLDSIREQLGDQTSSAQIDANDEVIGVAKLSSTRYLVDLQNAGSLEIDCRGISEY